jgi:hypothetical protein
VSVVSDNAINARSSQTCQNISFYFVKKVNLPVPILPFSQGFRELAGVAIIQNASAFLMLAANPCHTFLAMHLQRCIFAFAAFSGGAKMRCNAVKI